MNRPLVTTLKVQVSITTCKGCGSEISDHRPRRGMCRACYLRWWKATPPMWVEVGS